MSMRWVFRFGDDAPVCSIGALAGKEAQGLRQHVAPAAEHAIDAVVAEVHSLGVHFAMLDVGEAEAPRRAPRSRHHLGREVGEDQPPVRPDRAGSGKARLAGARRQLEDCLARLGPNALSMSSETARQASHIQLRSRSQPAAIACQIS
jgi:hypothetical protein